MRVRERRLSGLIGEPGRFSIEVVNTRQLRVLAHQDEQPIHRELRRNLAGDESDLHFEQLAERRVLLRVGKRPARGVYVAAFDEVVDPRVGSRQIQQGHSSPE